MADLHPIGAARAIRVVDRGTAVVGTEVGKFHAREAQRLRIPCHGKRSGEIAGIRGQVNGHLHGRAPDRFAGHRGDLHRHRITVRLRRGERHSREQYRERRQDRNEFDFHGESSCILISIPSETADALRRLGSDAVDIRESGEIALDRRRVEDGDFAVAIRVGSPLVE